MTGMEAEKNYGGFERFLFYFIPILFTLILTGVLLFIFGYNVVDKGLEIANKIPLVNKIVPEPKHSDAKEPSKAKSDNPSAAAADPELIKSLEDQLAAKNSEAKQAIDALQQKDVQIKDLQATIESLQQQIKQKTQTDDEYLKQVQSLAGVYADMNPSKAAPILENLTLNERVLVLNEMKTANRVALLQKMDPKIAAEASIMMKDLTPVKDTELKALQERLGLNDKNEPATKKISRGDLGLTFAQMTPKSAAAVLLEMNKSYPAKVIEILSEMGNSARSQIMSAISDASKDTAVKIAAKLGE